MIVNPEKPDDLTVKVWHKTGDFRREIGIRVALGARPSDITNLVVRRGIILALIGLGVGLAAALVLARFISGLLYAVSPFDSTNLLIVSLVLVGTTIVASYLPARRATRVEPMAALRYE